MGPKGCGKSTLIRSLVKLFTGQNLSSTTGPITCVAGRHRRVTFFECPNDIFSMTDLSKVADLVLLMVDASYGFEMETFEFLNQLQLHGFPKVVGVLTHLDGFKVNKSLQKTKKALKHRFWTEIYDGAKMFDMSGVMNGKYPKHEIKRISLYISRTKFRPLVWRNTHPYVVVDRVEDITPQDRLLTAAADGTSAEIDRDVTLYGYVRGTHLQPHHRVHLIGVGDFPIHALSSIEDPCHQPGAPGGEQQLQERATLKKKDNLLYAPLANVGRVKIDSDGVYIELKTVHYTKKENLVLGDQGTEGYGDSAVGTRGDTPADLLRSMQDADFSLDQRMRDSEMSLFSGSAGVKSSLMKAGETHTNEEEGDYEYDEYDDMDNDEGDEDDQRDVDEDSGEEDDDNIDNDEEEEEEEDDDDDDDDDEEEDNDSAVPYTTNVTVNAKAPSSSQWKVGMQDKAASSFHLRVADMRSKAAGGGGDIMHSVYGAEWSANRSNGAGDADIDDDNSDADEDEDDLFVAVKSSSLEKYRTNNSTDSNRLGQRQRAAGGKYFSAVDAVVQKNSNETRKAGSSSPNSTLFFDMLRMRFVTGGASAWAASIAHKKNGKSKLTDENDEENAEDQDEDGDDDGSTYGDFEDLQAGNGGEENASDSDGEEEEEDSDVDSEVDNDLIDKQLRDSYALKKSVAKTSFDTDYDNKKNKVRQIRWR